MARKKAIVFGGAGFIGCHLLKRLAAESSIRRFTASTSPSRVSPSTGVNHVSFDIREPIPPKLCGEGPFDIYNLAAVHTTPGHEDWEYYWTNVRGATNVCRFASEVDADAHPLHQHHDGLWADRGAEGRGCGARAGQCLWPLENLGGGHPRLWQAERPECGASRSVRPGVIYGLEERGNFTRLSQAFEGPALLLSGPHRYDQGLRLCRRSRLVDALHAGAQRGGDAL